MAMMICVDASDNGGKGTGLLTRGKEYSCIRLNSGYYSVICDDGNEYSKSSSRFKFKSELKSHQWELEL